MHLLFLFLQNFGNSANSNMNMNLIIPGRSLQQPSNSNIATALQAAGKNHMNLIIPGRSLQQPSNNNIATA